MEVYCFFLSITKVMTTTVPMTTPPTISPMMAPLLEPTSSAKNTWWGKRKKAKLIQCNVCGVYDACSIASYQFLMVHLITGTLPLIGLHPHLRYLVWLQGSYWKEIDTQTHLYSVFR